MILYLKNIVSETYTNTEGEKLYAALISVFLKNEKVILSFKDSSITSSSFLNSSFGRLIESYGLEKFKQSVSPKELTITQAEVLKKYISSFSKKDAA